MIVYVKALLTSMGILTPSYYLYNHYSYEDMDISNVYEMSVSHDYDYTIEMLCIIPSMYFLCNFSFYKCIRKILSFLRYVYNYSTNTKELWKYSIVMENLDHIQKSMDEINVSMKDMNRKMV